MYPTALGRLAHVFVAVMAVVLTAGCVVPVGPGRAAVPMATADPTQAALTAVQVVVKRLHTNQPDVVLQEGRKLDIRVNDQVAVEDMGRGLLRFPDGLTVEILKQTQLSLGEVRLLPDGFALTRIKQTLGQTHVELEEAARQRVLLQTELATVTAVPGSEVMIWHEPGHVTCIVTVKGEVEVAAQDCVVTTHAGEATYVVPGQPPSTPICANLLIVNTWLDKMRSGQPTRTLDQVVKSFPQKSCSGVVAASGGTPTGAAASVTVTRRWPRPLR